MRESRRALRILYIAYPLLPVSDESCGGAEQMLWTLARAMVARSHQVATAAAEGSRVPGELFSTGPPAQGADQFEAREAEHTERILAHIEDYSRAGKPFDLIHDKSGHFWRHSAQVQVPVLATLHLPRTMYPETLGAAASPNLFFNCVSDDQALTFTDLPNLLGVVRNGIALERFPLTAAKGTYLLWLGRICEEKAPDLAIEVARRVGLPLIIAGQVYPFSYHEQYYNRAVRPHLDGHHVRFIETPLFAKKVGLLRRARALLLPSLVAETSSLAAMEAMACGTPVIGFRRGGVPEVVADGFTGFVVDSAEQMAEAVGQVARIDSRACRRYVEANFSALRMAADYERLYEDVLRRAARAVKAA